MIVYVLEYGAFDAMCEEPFDAVKNLRVSEYGTTNGLIQCVKNRLLP